MWIINNHTEYLIKFLVIISDVFQALCTWNRTTAARTQIWTPWAAPGRPASFRRKARDNERTHSRCVQILPRRSHYDAISCRSLRRGPSINAKVLEDRNSSGTRQSALRTAHTVRAIADRLPPTLSLCVAEANAMYLLNFPFFYLFNCLYSCVQCLFAFSSLPSFIRMRSLCWRFRPYFSSYFIFFYY